MGGGELDRKQVCLVVIRVVVLGMLLLLFLLVGVAVVVVVVVVAAGVVFSESRFPQQFHRCQCTTHARQLQRSLSLFVFLRHTGRCRRQQQPHALRVRNGVVLRCCRRRTSRTPMQRRVFRVFLLLLLVEIVVWDLFLVVFWDIMFLLMFFYRYLEAMLFS